MGVELRGNDMPMPPSSEPKEVQCSDTSESLEKQGKKKTESQHQWRNFVFTLHDYTENDEELLRQVPYRYLVYGREKCPNTGRPHLQGYCELEKRLTFNTLTKFLPRAIHLEPRRGGQKSAIEYTKKDGDYEEFGEPRVQGARSDFELAKRYKTEGKALRELIEDPECTSGALSAFQRLGDTEYRSGVRLSRDTLLVYWIYGPSGAGKTKRAYELAGEDAYKADLFDQGWFNRYPGGVGIIIDDFIWDKSNYTLKKLLALMDIYEYMLNIKNGDAYLKSTVIVITSQYAPWAIFRPEKTGTFGKYPTTKPGAELYTSNKRLYQFMRRLTKVIHLKSRSEYIRWPELENVPEDVKHEMDEAEIEELLD